MNTRHFITIVSALTLFTWPVFISCAANENVRLAVIDLDVGSGLSSADGTTLTQFIIAEIVKAGKITVVYRQSVKKIFEEHSFSEAFVNPTQALVQAGKFMDANRILSGRVSKFGSAWTLTLTLVDVSTAQIISSNPITYEGEMKELLNVAQKAALDLLMMDPMAAESERKSQVAQWQQQISDLKITLTNLADDEKQELKRIGVILGGKLAGLNKDVDASRTFEAAILKKLDKIKQEHDPLRKQLDDVNAAKAAICNRYDPMVGKAQTSAIQAQETATKYHTDFLSAAAKLINDAIQYQHLSISTVPADGKYTDKNEGPEATKSGGFSKANASSETNEKVVGTVFAGEVFENNDMILNVGNWIIHQRAGDVMKSRDGSLLVVTQVSTRPTGNEIRFRKFVRFPTALDDVRLRQSFYMMYFRFVRDLAAYEVAARTAQNQLTTLEEGLKSELQKWNALNGEKLSTLQNQVSELAKQIAELNTRLATASADRANKESFLKKPLQEQSATIRREICAMYAEKKSQMAEQLATLEAKLKESRAAALPK